MDAKCERFFCLRIWGLYLGGVDGSYTLIPFPMWFPSKLKKAKPNFGYAIQNFKYAIQNLGIAVVNSMG